ncbi:L,D-transpeptidase family protein [Mongoliimonas terrestris]|uniref:L,D-transpeptidase family protein n=1 Tax=Mongoliimonas terrestris TaxID=1709001 RepID=UPI000A4B54F9|nr:L,D-transpeptidase [Mongoliimonas terrestris]
MPFRIRRPALLLLAAVLAAGLPLGPARSQDFDPWAFPGGRVIDPPVDRAPLAPPDGWGSGPYDGPDDGFSEEPPGPPDDRFDPEGLPEDSFDPEPLEPEPLEPEPFDPYATDPGAIDPYADDPDAPEAPLPGEPTPPADAGDPPAAPPSAAPAAPETRVPEVAAPATPGVAARPTLAPAALIEAVLAARFAVDADLGNRVPGKLAQSPLVVKMQILLDRAGLSPGVIDGYMGLNVQKAIVAFEAKHGLPVDGLMDGAVWSALALYETEPVLGSYTLTEADVAGPFVPHLPSDYGEMARLPGLSYRDAAEMLAERTHMDLEFLLQINPGADFTRAGTVVTVAAPGRPARTKVAHVVADKRSKQVVGYDAEGRIVVAYPATIGSASLPSPIGRHVVEGVAINPDYWYRPDVNFVQGNNRKALRLPPGPNGPVGSVWIDLSAPTYGIHGTPNPDAIDKGFSHGCVRLTNWDADELAHLVAKGVPVDFVD